MTILDFTSLLAQIEEHDRNYEIRAKLIFRLIGEAVELDMPVGIRVHEGWPVITIQLPRHGQISWHMEPDPTEWDGHDTEEKYNRARKWCKEAINAVLPLSLRPKNV